MPRDNRYRSKYYTNGVIRGLQLAEELRVQHPDDPARVIQDKINYVTKYGMFRGDESFGQRLKEQRNFAERIKHNSTNQQPASSPGAERVDRGGRRPPGKIVE